MRVPLTIARIFAKKMREKNSILIAFKSDEGIPHNVWTSLSLNILKFAKNHKHTPHHKKAKTAIYAKYTYTTKRIFELISISVSKTAPIFINDTCPHNS